MTSFRLQSLAVRNSSGSDSLNPVGAHQSIMDGNNPYSSWSMIPNMPSHSNSPATSNQDHLYLPQLLQQQQQFPQLHHQQPQQQQTIYQQVQQQRTQFQQQPQQQPHQSLASHFHLVHLVEKLADAVENGSRDQHSDALVSELNSHFEKCQQLLNSISGSISTKAMTAEGQKNKLEESEKLLNQRRELISKYRGSVEDLIKPEL